MTRDKTTLIFKYQNNTGNDSHRLSCNHPFTSLISYFLLLFFTLALFSFQFCVSRLIFFFITYLFFILPKLISFRFLTHVHYIHTHTHTHTTRTAFLPCEVVELKRQNVDINPEYSDSLDSELFTVHLMFEKPSAETALAAAAEAQRVGTELSNSSAVRTFACTCCVYGVVCNRMC